MDMQNNKYINRLVEEWMQHGKIIIAVDWDDTLEAWKFDSDIDKERYQRLWKLLKECQLTGAYIVLFTACNIDRYEQLKTYCAEKGLNVDGINRTPVNSIPYGKEGSKIYANIYLDDRAGLEEAAEILESALYVVRGKKQSIMHDYPGSLGI